MRLLSRLRHELLRPRGRARRNRRSGMALLVVIATMLVLTVLVTELSYNSHVRFLVATHRKERAQAYWIARSGVNLYKLILTANRQLGNSSAGDFLETMGISAGDALWQLVPMINTGLMRMVFATNGDVDELGDEALQEFQNTGKVSDQVREDAAESSMFSKDSFMDFDGDFSAEVTDVESKINVNMLKDHSTELPLDQNETAKALLGLMAGEENDEWFRERNLLPENLVADLADWVDADSNRSGTEGGYEDNLYNRLDPPYLAKNAPFDTMEEIRLVEGWSDEVVERFGKDLTVWGNGKVNINTASDELMCGLLQAYVTPAPLDAQCELYVEQIRTQMLLSDFNSGATFVNFLENDLGLVVDSSLANRIAKASYTFTITSTGLVENSAVTITTVVDYTSGYEGEVKYWRVD